MHTSHAITGTLENGQLVRLDEPVSLPAGRVRVTLEPLQSDARTGKTLVEWIKIARGQLKIRRASFPQQERDRSTDSRGAQGLGRLNADVS